MSPNLASLDLAALLLTLAALLAAFRFKVGMVTLLAGAMMAGLAIELAGPLL